MSVIAAFIYVYNDSKRDRVNDLLYTAKVIKSYYELSFNQWELSLLSVGNRMVEIADPQERLDYANKALEVYEDELLAFGFADTSGKVLTFPGNAVNASLPNLSDSENTKRSFDLSLDRKGITLGESYFFDNVGDWILPIRVPILNSENEIVAVNTSAIDYKTMVSELDRFGFDPHYQVSLINKDFGTLQLVYPLDSKDYDSILGSSANVYQNVDTLQRDGESFLFYSEDPNSDYEFISASTSIDVVNHQLVVSVNNLFIVFEFLNRFKYIFLVYVLLTVASAFLYGYMKRNLARSILELRTERANLKSIFESTSSIVGLFDREKKLVEYNKPFFESALATDDMKLHKGMDVLAKMKHRENVEVFRSFFDKALAGEKVKKEFTHPGPEGDLAFRFTYNPVYDGDQVVGLTFFGEDITKIRGYQQKLESYNKDLEKEVEERTKELQIKNEELEEGYKKIQSTQQQLIRAEKMASLGILSAGIGHEINNPLNFIKHGAISLKEQLEKDHKGHDYSEYFFAVEEGVRRASTIVSGLSHFSRAGEAMDEDCNLHQILENSLTLLSNRLKAKDIAIRKDFAAEKFNIKGNEGKLHQVFTNIINNAEQAIEEKGEITIATCDGPNGLSISITDSGMGMSEAVLKKILDPFFTTKEPGEGTGLGMFICQMILDEHNATMNVFSKENEGTTFTITF